jgi:hypothetical protein
MRAIEVWLAETGWGSNDTLISTSEDADPEEDREDSEAGEGGRNNSGNSEDEVSEVDAVSNCTTRSDEGSDLDVDPDIEYVSSENEEETMDGEYGFSSL